MRKKGGGGRKRLVSTVMADERERDRFCSVAHLNLPSPAPQHSPSTTRHFPQSVPPQRLSLSKKKSLFFTFQSRVQIPPRLLPSVTPAVLVTGTDDPNGFSETSASSPLIPGAGTGARSCRTTPPKSRRMPDLKTMDIDAQLRLRPPLRGAGFVFFALPPK